MKKFLIAFLAIQLGYSQTKLIAHKSHSGTSNTFNKAMESHSFLRSSDFGLPRTQYYNYDTLKYVSNKLVIGKFGRRVDSLTAYRFSSAKGDMAVIEDLLEENKWIKFPYKIVVENFKIKNAENYYKTKYRNVKVPTKDSPLKQVTRTNNGTIIITTNQKNDTLKGYEIFEIKEKREIKWLMSQSYDIKNTKFNGFTRPKRERYRTVITSRNPLINIDSIDQIETIKYFEKITKRKNRVGEKTSCSLKNVKVEKKLKKELNKKTEKKEEKATPVFNTENKQPPFNGTFIILLVITTISIIIGLTYKLLAPKINF